MEPLLSINRMLVEKYHEPRVPSTSLMAVGINREVIENFRKDKHIKVKLFENTINLSKSRYYRWIQYDSDLPLEHVMGIKKILALTDDEFMQIFKPSTEDIVQTLVMLSYSITNLPTTDDLYQKLTLELAKHVKVKENIQLYQLLNYLIQAYDGKLDQSVVYQVKYIKDYLINADDYTMFETLLALTSKAILLVNQKKISIAIIYDMVLSWIKTNISSPNRAVKQVAWGSLFDSLLLNFYADKIDQIKVTIRQTKKLIKNDDYYNEFIFMRLILIVDNQLTKSQRYAELIKLNSFLTKHAEILPKFEKNFWNITLIKIKNKLNY